MISSAPAEKKPDFLSQMKPLQRSGSVGKMGGSKPTTAGKRLSNLPPAPSPPRYSESADAETLLKTTDEQRSFRSVLETQAFHLDPKSRKTI